MAIFNSYVKLPGGIQISWNIPVILDISETMQVFDWKNTWKTPGFPWLSEFPADFPQIFPKINPFDEDLQPLASQVGKE